MYKAVEVQNLSLGVKTGSRYTEIAENISFTLYKRERLGIVGESGSGKTQTVLSLLGLTHPNIKPLSGRILFEDNLVWDAAFAGKRSERKKLAALRGNDIGIIFQDARASLLPHLTIEEQARETWLTLRPEIGLIGFESQTTFILQKLGFSDPKAILAKYPVQLSGGQAQRAYIMLALLGQPTVLIADEPTSSLDPYTSRQIIELIQKFYKEQYLSLIIISHDLAEIMTITDRIIVMYAGRIVEEIPTKVLKEGGEPYHPYARFLFSMATGELFGRLREAAADSPVFREDYLNGHKKAESGCPYASRCALKKTLPEDLQRKCTTNMPPLTDRGNQRKAACWGVGDEKA
ncbi:peptide/nickel transport system ATP-binding protein [Cyclonatronum proteinivorum]|uniref:Peptide/nickel transport system ATP-binding protein n=1 Tax=Cyclonatronum proteinivorum TaxID=1457365 RepID=A0A345UHK0_9BACT|nr:ABC transporter ATP-binding protein [Cyclonatronum proteinivorum]AXI99951.1 peptide/nickel transport system ATP-binding protein [Cyclonatronum proteinivorum]